MNANDVTQSEHDPVCVNANDAVRSGHGQYTVVALPCICELVFMQICLTSIAEEQTEQICITRK